MDGVISKQKAIDILRENVEEVVNALQNVAECLDDVDPVEFRAEKSEWVPLGRELFIPVGEAGSYKVTRIRLEICARCGFEKTEYARWYNYCPVCGRRMFKTLEELKSKKKEVSV